MFEGIEPPPEEVADGDDDDDNVSDELKEADGPGVQERVYDEELFRYFSVAGPLLCTHSCTMYSNAPFGTSESSRISFYT